MGAARPAKTKAHLPGVSLIIPRRFCHNPVTWPRPSGLAPRKQSHYRILRIGGASSAVSIAILRIGEHRYENGNPLSPETFQPLCLTMKACHATRAPMFDSSGSAPGSAVKSGTALP